MALPQRYIEKDHYTEEEYLRWEEDAPYKSEYVRGEIRAMAGGTVDHGTIAVNVSVGLKGALRGRGCRVLSSDVKIRTGDGVLRYPDVSVVCGEIRFHGRGRSVITNPLIVVEVLSDGTAATDRGEKLQEYQTIESLQCYLLVNQTSPRVECYERRENGRWDYQAVIGRDSVLEIPTLTVTLVLAEIYDEISFAAEIEEAQ